MFETLALETLYGDQFTLLYTRLTMKILIDRLHSYTITCEVDVLTQYLQQISSYHVEFKVYLVSKPLVHVVFSNFCKLKDISNFVLSVDNSDLGI